jgi:hypothetical protein
MILNENNIKHTLFIDIETVSEKRSFDDLSEVYKALWLKKASKLGKNTSDTEIDHNKIYSGNAAIYAEFGKVVCISAGYISVDGKLRIKTFAGKDEAKVLKDFVDMLAVYFYDPQVHSLCGHNIKEFDIAYLCRRMVKHCIQVPNIMDISGKKPWQVEQLVDTLELWRFGDYKNYTSLSLLCAMLDIPSPKEDIDGSMVGHVYWQENDLGRIARYCSNDIIAVVQVLLKLARLPLLEKDAIEVIPWIEASDEEE